MRSHAEFLQMGVPGHVGLLCCDFSHPLMSYFAVRFVPFMPQFDLNNVTLFIEWFFFYCNYH